ncbi:DUF1573 domain-containing protein [Siphonobacter sp.]|uniref:DUF1573 domain-containing protein n=1 Tax=Siphonobacter sp. TaxID=1869184 RepID=UPI003B3A5107
MKKQLFFLLAFFLISAGAFAQGKIKVDSETKDFGKIAQGTPVTHEFTVTNTGKAPVVISNVTASCGCTTPKWSQAPILPGKTSKVSATYNAASVGPFNKQITVYSNAENSTITMFLKGEVQQKAAAKGVK